MNTYVSLLRGVNVSGHRKVSMADLKLLYASLGFENVRTYLQSGNVVFDHNVTELPELSGKIKSALDERFGLDIAVITRSSSDIRKLIAGNPFRGKNEKKLHVTFLSERPEQIQNNEKIKKAVGPGEAFFVADKEIYLFCPSGYGGTKMTNAFLERLFKVQATTRNWNTVNALAAMTDRRN